MTALEVIVALAGLYVALGLAYAVIAGFTAGLRAKTAQRDCDKTLRELIAALPVVISEVGPYDDIIDVRQTAGTGMDPRTERPYPADSKPTPRRPGRA